MPKFLSETSEKVATPRSVSGTVVEHASYDREVMWFKTLRVLLILWGGTSLLLSLKNGWQAEQLMLVHHLKLSKASTVTCFQTRTRCASSTSCTTSRPSSTTKTSTTWWCGTAPAAERPEGGTTGSGLFRKEPTNSGALSTRNLFRRSKDQHI